jgi:hypothetical protein
MEGAAAAEAHQQLLGQPIVFELGASLVLELAQDCPRGRCILACEVPLEAGGAAVEQILLQSLRSHLFQLGPVLFPLLLGSLLFSLV